MAVLNKIRQRSVFLIVIIALALFSFVLADVIRNGGLSSQKSQNVVATVNGEEISREDFARQVDAYQQNMGPNATTSQVVNQVWDLKLREVVLQEEFEKLGINVGEAQVRQLLRLQLAQNPNFVNEVGMFDENKLQEYVANLKATSPQAYDQWVAYENSIAESAKENIYYNMVRAGIGATLLEGEQAYRMENDNVDLKFVQLPYSSIADTEVSVSKDEIKDYVKKHSERFQVEKSRDIQFVYFPEEASSDDDTEAKAVVASVLNSRVEFNSASNENDTLPSFSEASDVEAFVNQNSDIQYQDRILFKNDLKGSFTDQIFNLNEGETYGPYKEGGYWKVTKMVEAVQIADSAKASHIMISWKGLPTAAETLRTKEEAKTLADSLAGVVRKDKGSFEALAAQYSADVASKDKGGDLGFFRPGSMIKSFNDYVFNNNKGDIGVVESEFGYHIISIEDKTAEERGVKLATIAREIEPSEKSLNNLYTKVTKFEIAAKDKDKDFAEVAKADNYEVKTVRGMKVLEENIPGVGAQRRIVQWSFEDDVKAGDIKRFEVAGGYVVAQITAVKDKGLMSSEEASASVTPILMKEKKAKLLKEKANGASLAEIAKNNGVSVQSASAINLNNPTLAGAGNEPEVVGAAFSLKPGVVSKPISGDKGVYVVEMVSMNAAPKMDSYKSFAMREASQRRQAVVSRVFEALKENADIEDNRARFY
ncbi:peptidylprolyl isomerase/peptidyl-prolyl cis-trans isomerase D [Gillisia mitskevichiae]|uniref:Periplasmic chaperone PpiD n=1 Tax=Gillisia mitskevichiae TaxID=270921 RepID=A0A495PV84_9FLAO|nr:peptidylprolyl isomerase [Gillisia mitskevichiae]RKS55095.1 peptidylprolyl isomerase/peptidyl-prolyl cis-trans isomerase D [Gillisia mitskevichiae]